MNIVNSFSEAEEKALEAYSKYLDEVHTDWITTEELVKRDYGDNVELFYEFAKELGVLNKYGFYRTIEEIAPYVKRNRTTNLWLKEAALELAANLVDSGFMAPELCQQIFEDLGYPVAWVGL